MRNKLHRISPGKPLKKEEKQKKEHLSPPKRVAAILMH